MSFLKKCFIVVVSLVFVQCAKNNNYLIDKGNVGNINKQTTLEELKLIFENDSISLNNSESVKNKEIFIDNEEYYVFTKEGKKLLEIVPVENSDSIVKIKSIQIFDSNYITDKGISLKSTFKDINASYMVNKVETTLTSATLFIDELNATISIDKKELGLNSFSRDEISIDQIPDIAKIKYFTIWFN
ncbi:hypothetical protein [Lutibacter citreus]|uniref:hypothetical protein n=1 Tax=Lutibacter citreus TaxID=2138210 RepID=UPI000DBE6FA4|nr:hypothetical protein [Lutibacter citreus]